MYYLVIALFVLMLIGFISSQKQKKEAEAEAAAQAQAQVATKTKAIMVANAAPKKYGYVPPPAYNPYKSQYYN